MKRYDFLYILCLLALLCGTISSCSEDPLADGLPEENPHGLVLQLAIDGNPVVTPSAASTRIAADPTLNENLVEKVDVFFFSNDDLHKHVNATLGTDYRIVLAGADWKTQFPAMQYDIYVVANRHKDTDLSGISTVAELMKLIDTDNEVYRVEGERMSESKTYSGKTFLMDGKVTWTPPATDDATIEVDLKRAAAKIVVNVSFSEAFITDQIDIIGVRKKVVNYVPQVVAFADAGYREMEVMGDASTSDFADTDHTNGEQGAKRKDVLYAYTYPNHWGENMERETYLLVNVPYNDNNGTDKTNDDTPYLYNYYKVPIRFSADTDELHLDRNMQYTVNVTIDRKGNTEIDQPVTLTPTFNVAEWKTKDINVDNDSPNYLVLSDYDIEMHNEEKVTIEFFSSSPLAANNMGVQITEAYYVDKDGNNATTQHYYYIETDWWGNSNLEQITNRDGVDIKDLCEITWDENTLTGTITFKSEFIKEYQSGGNHYDNILAATNITARYFTLLVTNTDSPATTKEVKITQYPLEYIMGVPGWYSTRSDFGANWEDHENEKEFNDSPTVSNTVFSSKYFNEDDKHIYTYISRGVNSRWVDWGIFGGYWEYYGPPYEIVSGEDQNPQNNNRMYLVQLTSTNSEYTIARPKTDYENGQLITVDSEENNELVSPAFMLASQLGTVSSGISWSNAKEQCKNYIEVIKFSDDEEPYRLDDWRLPTRQELSIIADYQKRQPQVLDEVLRGSRYWTARDGVAYDVPNSTTSGTGVRCIRDVTPADLEEFANHGIR
ncbi:DUF1566 domain-containing protein [Bacteroides sp. An51A]|uniref:fimbrial tip adhesin FimD n=1 Tax=Bacteroides sp. An51A TaxID=1965640 RepID=UPI000B3686F5|nr:DUF1566 domain-containing protein [Bacteroides sp. An51A]OUN80409.1 hypothetical protein B5G04_08420 [Bacteroides sp. An51A]